MKIYAENKVHLAVNGLTLCGLAGVESIDKVTCEECIKILNELKKEAK
jgi:hypothetical protein